MHCRHLNTHALEQSYREWNRFKVRPAPEHDSNAVILLVQDGRTAVAGDQLLHRWPQQEVGGPCEGTDYPGSWEEGGSPR